jgi:hypothetical protein
MVGVNYNTYALITEIRRQALNSCDKRTYALMVFDCAMLQLGGLAIQSRGNKIQRPDDAFRLADLTATWLSSLLAK